MDSCSYKIDFYLKNRKKFLLSLEVGNFHIVMGKEILLYGYIYAYSAAQFFKDVADAGVTAGITIRINTEGGEPEYAWGIIAKIQELKNVKFKVDGQAHSIGAFMLCYVDDVEAVDTAQFILHRGAWPDWVEQSATLFTDRMKEELANVNAKLEKAFRNKIDVAAFEEMKGVKVKDIFSMDGRLEVILTAKEAKQIKLIDRIVTITPTKKAEIEKLSIAASRGNYRIAADVPTPPENKPIMTLEELKTKHPEIYALAVQDGEKIGVAKERTRVKAWSAFAKIAPEEVTKGISEGADVDMAVMADMQMKGLAAVQLGKLAAGVTPPVSTDPAALAATEKTAKEKELEEYSAKTAKIVGLKNPVLSAPEKKEAATAAPAAAATK